MTWRWQPLALAAAVALAGCGGGSSGSHAASSYTLRGSVVTDDVTAALRDHCSQGEDINVQAGTAVTVKDGSGTILGVGRLGSGHPVDTSVVLGGACAWPFRVAGLKRSAFYTLAIPGHGSQDYSFGDLSGAGWSVHLTIRG